MKNNHLNCSVKGCGVCDKTAQNILTNNNTLKEMLEDLRDEYCNEKTFSDKILKRIIVKENSIEIPRKNIEEMDFEVADWWIEKIEDLIQQAKKETAEEILKECIGEDGLIDRDCAVRDGVGKCLDIINNINNNE